MIRFALMLAVGLLAAIGQDSSPRRAGDFTIEPPKYNHACAVDEHGGVGQMTQRIFYKGTLVTAVSFTEFVSPRNPGRLIFSVSPSCGDTEAANGTFYYDGARGTTAKVAISATDDQPEKLNALWSPDDRFVVLPMHGMQLSLVNLQTSQTTDLAKLLYNHDSVISSADFAGWSPDGKSLAVSISSMFNRANGRMSAETDLVALDPATLNATYVATMRKKDGWALREFSWVAKDGGYELAPAAELQNSLMIFRKNVLHPPLNAK